MPSWYQSIVWKKASKLEVREGQGKVAVQGGRKTCFFGKTDCHPHLLPHDLLALLPDSDKIFWIGLTNLVNNWGQWTWLDGTAVLYGNWADGIIFL